MTIEMIEEARGMTTGSSSAGSNGHAAPGQRHNSQEGPTVAPVGLFGSRKNIVATERRDGIASRQGLQGRRSRTGRPIDAVGHKAASITAVLPIARAPRTAGYPAITISRWAA